jgi:hypothetical protein
VIMTPSWFELTTASYEPKKFAGDLGL